MELVLCGGGGRAKSVLGILFTFWVMGFLVYKQKGSFFLPRGTGIKVGSRAGSVGSKVALGSLLKVMHWQSL